MFLQDIPSQSIRVCWCTSCHLRKSRRQNAKAYKPWQALFCLTDGLDLRPLSRLRSLRAHFKDVFEGHTSTGSEPFSLFICLDANKFVLLSFFSLIKRIYPRVSNKPLPNDAKGPLPVDVRRSTTLLLKLPITKLRDTARSRVTHDSDGSRPWQKKGWEGAVSKQLFSVLSLV